MSDPITTASAQLQPTRFCVRCLYNLYGITSDRCPECGLPIDKSNVSSIPWEHRQTLGNTAAFLRTILLAILHPRLMAQSPASPAKYKQSRTFRIIVALIASLAPAAIVGASLPESLDYLLGYHARVISRHLRDELILIHLTGVALWPIIPLGFVIAFQLAAPCWRRWQLPAHAAVILQNRSMMMSNYAAAPLILTPLPVLATAAAILFQPHYYQPPPVRQLHALLLVIAIFSGLPMFYLLIRTIIILLAATVDASPLQIAAAIVFMALRWIAALVAGLLVWPTFAGLFALMLQGLFR
jgi:hypothetical protein